MEEEFLKFFRENNIQPQKIPQRVLDYICENFPSKCEKIKNYFYFLVNFDNEKFREILKKFEAYKRFCFGLSSESLHFVIIDVRLKYPEPLIVHELVELLIGSQEEANKHELLFANQIGIEGYDENFKNFDWVSRDGKIKELEEIEKKEGIPFTRSWKVNLRKKMEKFFQND